VGANTDGDVEVEPKRQLAFVGFHTTAVDLFVGHPLDELKQLDRFRLGLTELSEVRVFHSPPSVGPFPPGMAELPPKPFEASEAGERRSARIAKAREGLTPFFRAMPEKRFVCELEGTHLGVCDPFVINDVQSPQAIDLLVQAGSFEAGKFRNRVHVDVERIEKESAVRSVGT